MIKRKKPTIDAMKQMKEYEKVEKIRRNLNAF